MQAYESDPAIPDDFKLEIMIMAEALEKELASIQAMTEAQLFEKATSTKKRKPDEVAGKRRDRAVAALDDAARKIAALATQHGLPDLSPHGVEIAKQRAWEAKVLKPVQAQVEAILAKHKAAILAAIPGASVKYRGSLASGWKGPHKLSKDGAALQFDPKSFDCDAFIEVPSATWSEWVRQGAVGASAVHVDLDDFSGASAAALQAIQGNRCICPTWRRGARTETTCGCAGNTQLRRGSDSLLW